MTSYICTACCFFLSMVIVLLLLKGVLAFVVYYLWRTYSCIAAFVSLPLVSTRDFTACSDDFLSVVSFFSFLLVFAGFVVVDANIYVSPEVLYFPKTACWCGSRKKKEERRAALRLKVPVRQWKEGGGEETALRLKVPVRQWREEERRPQ